MDQNDKKKIENFSAVDPHIYCVDHKAKPYNKINKQKHINKYVLTCFSSVMQTYHHRIFTISLHSMASK